MFVEKVEIYTLVLIHSNCTYVEKVKIYTLALTMQVD